LLGVVGQEVVDHPVEQGGEKVFLAGVAGFAASSAAIGLSGSIAGSITLVIAFRALQGVFGAMLQPTALALLRKNFPAEKLNAAIGIWGAVIGASTAAGPIVGGLLVQHIGWEACFYINIPVGLIAVAASLLVLRETDPSPAARSFDIPGIAALSGALFLLIWGLIKGPDYGWSSAPRSRFSAPPRWRACCSSSARPAPPSPCCRCGCSAPRRCRPWWCWSSC
jgi:MFS family permease